MAKICIFFQADLFYCIVQENTCSNRTLASTVYQKSKLLGGDQINLQSLLSNHTIGLCLTSGGNQKISLGNMYFVTAIT